MLVFSFFTTLNVLSSIFDSHLDNLSFFKEQEKSWSQFKYLSTYSKNNYQPESEILEKPNELSSFSKDGLLCLCGGEINNDVKDVCSNLFQEYHSLIRKGEIYTSPRSQTSVSCILHDSYFNRMWLIADNAGVHPLWYQLPPTNLVKENKEHVIVTQDLIGAMRLGFEDLNTVPIQTGLLIDLNSMEIIQISNAKHYNDNNFDNMNLKIYSLSLYQAAVLAGPPGHIDESAILYELHADALSRLVVCAGLTRGGRRVLQASAPVITRTYTDTEIKNGISQLLEGIPDDVIEVNAHVWSGDRQLRRLLLNRYDACVQASSSETETALFLAPHAEALFMYMTNLMCSKVGVSVLWAGTYIDTDNTSNQLTTLSQLWEGAMIHDAVSLLEHDERLCTPVVDMFEHETGNTKHQIGISTATFQVDEWDPNVDGRVDTERKRSHEIGKSLQWQSTGSFNSSIGDLYAAAIQVSQISGDIFVAVVTSGFEDMFANFLCHAISVIVTEKRTETKLNQQDQPKYSLPLLVVTDSPAVEAMAGSAGAVSYRADLLSSLSKTGQNGEGGRSREFVFGSISYQQVMLARTSIVFDLLILGFRPVVVDVDTVWLKNPLEAVRTFTSDSGMFDMAVTDDSGEVCGCFIYLNNTINTLSFWGTVLHYHQKLLDEARTSDDVEHFESEQKIITRMLHKPISQGGYDGNLNVYQLPSHSFPSGMSFFNENGHGFEPLNEANPVVVIHNNYIIGVDAKRSRFERYGFWQARRDVDYTRVEYVLNEFQSDICQHDPMEAYQPLGVAIRDVYIPSLLLVAPLYDTSYPIDIVENTNDDDRLKDTESITVMVSSENQASNVQENILMVLGQNTKDTYVFGAAFNLVKFRGLVEGTHSMTIILDKSNLAWFVDWSLGSMDASIDIIGHRDRYGKVISDFDSSIEDRRREIKDIADMNAIADVTEDESRSYPIERYCIKVITYRRSSSLQRLLKSLLNADYGNFRVDLEILVDGPKSGGAMDEEEEEKRDIQTVIEVAKSFLRTWPFSGKLTVQPSNIGLPLQWYSAWDATDDSEACFVFEDDVEVSPLYFLWSVQAVNKYHTRANHQAHEDLFNRSYDPQGMEDYAKKYAGKGVMYGVCLQNQHLDPSHYPMRASNSIHTSKGPFLYSLIGSWGPLLLPVSWRAFKEWWHFRSSSSYAESLFEPLTETIIVNDFYLSNPNLWTPWHVRFAFETGSKCLYTNLPGNLSFVVNHREAGENYATPQGLTAQVLENEHLSQSYALQNEQLMNNEKNPLTITIDSIVNSWPTVPELRLKQVDLRMRMAGSIGLRSLLVPSACNNSIKNSSSTSGCSLRSRFDSLLDHSIKKMHIFYVAVDVQQDHLKWLDSMKSLWPLAIDMISPLVGGARLWMHLKASPLLYLMNEYHNTHNELFGTWNLQNTTIVDVVVYPLSLDKQALPSIMDLPFRWRYLLFLGVSCAGGPTDIEFLDPRLQRNVNATLVHEICSESGSDVGVRLFVHSVAMEAHGDKQVKVENPSGGGWSFRNALLRRINGGFIERRFVDKVQQAVYV